ncbi:hypothetical protein LDC_2517 [sediment metagenome]|uniref:Uncharacterized protein n=1 Tax=sediment metagenome TaxID=749907 RepID=D9PLU1_9ZZZZ
MTQSPYSVTHVNYTAASPILTYNYNVFANTTALGVTAVTSANLTPTVADGLEKNAVATLKDTYGNNIVPATGISRTIDFNFSTTNTLYLNQYSRTGNAVFGDIPSENNNFTQRYANGALNTSFNSQPSTD